MSKQANLCGTPGHLFISENDIPRKGRKWDEEEGEEEKEEKKKEERTATILNVWLETLFTRDRQSVRSVCAILRADPLFL